MKSLIEIADQAERLAIVAAKRRTRAVLYTTARGAVYQGKVASGELYNSYAARVEVRSKTKINITLSAAEHIQWILEGRPPHPGDDSKLIPIQGQKGSKFRQWAAKKGRNPYAVRRNIQKYGIKALALDKEIADEAMKALRVLFGQAVLEIVKTKFIMELK